MAWFDSLGIFLHFKELTRRGVSTDPGLPRSKAWVAFSRRSCVRVTARASAHSWADAGILEHDADRFHFEKPSAIELARPRPAISEKLMRTNNTVQPATMKTSRCRSGVSSCGQIRSDARG